jgi:uncharacterized protein YfbU (UPF0304 family)
MSMITYVRGIIPADEKYKEMLSIYNACEKAQVTIPEEVMEFFNRGNPNPNGMEIEIKRSLKEVHEDGCNGFIVDISKLPKNVKLIKFVNSW